MMIFGIAYRLIPMFLPAKPPQGWRLWLSFGLLEAGVLGLAASFLFHEPATPIFAVLIAAGIGFFFVNVVWMLRHRVPAPPRLRRPDVGMVQTMVSLLEQLCERYGSVEGYLESANVGEDVLTRLRDSAIG